MLANVHFYYFSPTGGTKACGEVFCSCISQKVHKINLGQQNVASESESDLAVFALPVFGGRVPAFAAEKIRKQKGLGKKAVTLVVYGVRAYEDALLELNHAVEAAGFSIVASGAVVAQHSIAPAVGKGRPDKEDKESIANFAKEVMKKLENSEKISVKVPGNFPYKDSMRVSASPICLPDCTRCGACASVCPTNAIHLEEDGIKTEVASCILCMACTAACPRNLRVLPEPMQKGMNEKLAALIPVHRENEYFL